MNEFEDIVARLGSLASPTVDEAVAQRHLAGLASVPTAAVPQYRSRARTLVAGALVVGAMAGSATVAGALTGTLPGKAQEKAATALGKVGIDVPKGNSAEAKAKAKAGDTKAKGQSADGTGADKAGMAQGGAGGTDRFLGDATTPCTLPDGSAFIGNHGDYVAAHPDDPATPDVDEREVAAQSPCGKPLQAVDGERGGKPDHAGKPASPGKSADHSGRADAGKPSDSGKPTTTTTTVDEEDGDTDGAGSTPGGKPGPGGKATN